MFLDLELPGGAAGELLRQLRDDPDLASVIVIGTESAVSPEHQPGIDAHLRKPFDFYELLGVLERVCADEP